MYFLLFFVQLQMSDNIAGIGKVAAEFEVTLAAKRRAVVAKVAAALEELVEVAIPVQMFVGGVSHENDSTGISHLAYGGGNMQQVSTLGP